MQTLLTASEVPLSVRLGDSWLHPRAEPCLLVHLLRPPARCPNTDLLPTVPQLPGSRSLRHICRSIPLIISCRTCSWVLDSCLSHQPLSITVSSSPRAPAWSTSHACSLGPMGPIRRSTPQAPWLSTWAFWWDGPRLYPGVAADQLGGLGQVTHSF